MKTQTKINKGLEERAKQRDNVIKKIKDFFNKIINDVEDDFFFINEKYRRPIVIASTIILLIIPYGLTVALAIKGLKDNVK